MEDSRWRMLNVLGSSAGRVVLVASCWFIESLAHEILLVWRILGIQSVLRVQVARLSEDESKAKASIAGKNARVADLKSSIARLQLSLEAGPGWTDEQKKTRKELQDQLTAVMTHAEARRTNLSVLRRDLGTLEEHVDRVEGEMAAIEKEKADVRAEIEAVIAKTSRLTKAKEAKDAEIKSLQTEIDSLHRELAEQQSSLKDADTMETKQQNALKTRVAETERVVSQYGKIHKQTVKLTDELDRQVGALLRFLSIHASDWPYDPDSRPHVLMPPPFPLHSGSHCVPSQTATITDRRE